MTTLAELRSALAKPKRPHIRVSDKSQRTDADGIVHDSKAEMLRWKELQLRERAGEISYLRRQMKFPLTVNGGEAIMIYSPRYQSGRAVTYTADFAYRNSSGRLVIEDVKGAWTDYARLKIAIFEACYGTRVLITGAAKMRRRA
ncbi:MAG: DUF1064 domain-containing protein [Patescibacteria group bacterium]|nr:DUF1064 domain-containing protein [Patescibacteria group bacterium]